MIHEQISAAFEIQLDLDQTFHGVRAIKLGKHGSRSSLFYSRKNGGFIPVESRLELRHCYQLEADRTVMQYRSQAISILQGARCLVPDFLVANVDGTFAVHEVKVSAHLTEKLRSKLQFLAEVLRGYGVPYKVITEQNFPAFHVEQNCVMLYDRGGRLPASDLQIARVCSLAQDVPPADRTVCRVRFELKTAGMPSYLLEHALFKGALDCDLTRAISLDSLVEVHA
jgi:hypothetical protein